MKLPRNPRQGTRTVPMAQGMRRAALFLSVAAIALGGCQNRKVKVEIAASGDGATRTFATNDTSARALAAAAEAYGGTGERDAELGRRFSGTFAESAMPSEIGNRGAIGRLDSSLGSARAYYEQFAEPREEWTAMRERVEGGILWMQIFGRFIELRKLKTDAERADFAKWWNDEATPLVADAYLMYSGMQAVAQSQRIGARLRGRDEEGPRTDDETFRISVFQPLAILLAERGWLEPAELAAIQMTGMKGGATAREREWLSERIVTPAVTRIVARFDPSRKDMKLKDFAPLGLEFLLWLKVSREYRDLVLASPAISDAIKESVRKGAWDFELPPPFGFRLLERPQTTAAEVILDTGAEPFFTNGVWNAETRRVEFKGAFYETKYRYAPYTAPYYAFWSLPSQRQESLFGAVILEGEALAQYCAWENALADDAKAGWLAALDALGGSQDPAPALEIVLSLAKDHPAPLALARWLAVKAGREIPEPFLTPEERKKRREEGTRPAQGEGVAAAVASRDAA
ncbi:MAG: hypothetical protein GC172_10815 [Phycisphaera sp.]|nr:hypothetical protein [Phycisphaera sp.]